MEYEAVVHESLVDAPSLNGIIEPGEFIQHRAHPLYMVFDDAPVLQQQLYLQFPPLKSKGDGLGRRAIEILDTADHDNLFTSDESSRQRLGAAMRTRGGQQPLSSSATQAFVDGLMRYVKEKARKH